MNREELISLGRQLRDARRKANYSQAECAQILGRSRAQIIDYEKGNVEPPLEILLRAAVQLNTEFAMAGYRLIKERLAPLKKTRPLTQKQLTFTFYKNRAPQQTAVQVVASPKKVVVTATVEVVNI